MLQPRTGKAHDVSNSFKKPIKALIVLPIFEKLVKLY